MTQEALQFPAKTQDGIMILTGRSNRDHLTLCLLAGMRKYIKEPVNNYENIKEFTQETDENPALFQGRLVETFRKYT